MTFLPATEVGSQKWKCISAPQIIESKSTGDAIWLFASNKSWKTSCGASLEIESAARAWFSIRVLCVQAHHTERASERTLDVAINRGLDKFPGGRVQLPRVPVSQYGTYGCARPSTRPKQHKPLNYAGRPTVPDSTHQHNYTHSHYNFLQIFTTLSSCTRPQFLALAEGK